MNGSSAISRFFEYQKANCKKNTVRNDHFFLPKFDAFAKTRSRAAGDDITC